MTYELIYYRHFEGTCCLHLWGSYVVSHLLDWTFQTAIHFKSRHWTKVLALCPREVPTGKEMDGPCTLFVDGSIAGTSYQ